MNYTAETFLPGVVAAVLCASLIVAFLAKFFGPAVKAVIEEKVERAEIKRDVRDIKDDVAVMKPQVDRIAVLVEQQSKTEVALGSIRARQDRLEDRLHDVEVKGGKRV